MALGISIPASVVAGATILPLATEYQSHGPIPAGTIVDTIRWHANFFSLPAVLKFSPVITFSDSNDEAAHTSGLALISSSTLRVNGRAAIFFQPSDLAQSPLIGDITSDWPIETSSAYLLIGIVNGFASGSWQVFTNVTFKKLPGFKP